MNTLDTIAARRSIRKFSPDPVSDDALRAILTAAIQAPSGKNRQPWHFTVVRADKRAEMVRIMREGIASRQAQGIQTGSAEWTASHMEEAPVTIFIHNPESTPFWLTRSIHNAAMDVVDTQSVGAAIQNMLLAAQDLGLGTLWICDVFFAAEELTTWLGETGALIAAVSIGHPAESPDPRPRKPIEEVTRWL